MMSQEQLEKMIKAAEERYQAVTKGMPPDISYALGLFGGISCAMVVCDRGCTLHALYEQRRAEFFAKYFPETEG